jgi:hypothetical protein
VLSQLQTKRLRLLGLLVTGSFAFKSAMNQIYLSETAIDLRATRIATIIGNSRASPRF